jgi:hypothetical protein
MGGNSAPLDDYDLIADEVGSEFDVVEPPPGPRATRKRIKAHACRRVPTTGS